MTTMISFISILYGKVFDIQHFLKWAKKNPPAMQETWVWSLGREDPLEKGTATHSIVVAMEV